jgi:phosphatidylserine/phosphatidylglycerophosphate/cardiolipin synthase-like enzyme
MPPTPTTAPTLAGPRLTLITEPEQGSSPIVAALEGAQQSIRVKVYLLTDSDIIAALKEAKGRGVDVKVLLEERPYGGGTTNAQASDELKAAGIAVQWSSRTFVYTHEKSIVVDDGVAYIMTANLTGSAFTANREYIVVDRDPADVAEIVRVFEADWARTTPDLSQARLVWSPVNSRQRILELIDSAQKSLDLEQEVLNDPEVEQHLLAAAKRGVEVRFVSSPSYPIEQDVSEPARARLRSGGAQVRYLEDPFIHAKVIIVDGKRALVGSINLSANSLDFNRELGIIFDDAGPVGGLAAAFATDWSMATAKPFPVGEATVPASEAISWHDAANYYNREVTIEGKIIDTKNTGKVIYLNFSKNYKTDLKVVIFPSDAAKFPEPPEKLFLNKTIRVTGRVEKYQDAPEIVVHDPSQIVVVEK